MFGSTVDCGALQCYFYSGMYWHVLNDFQRKERDDGGMHRANEWVLYLCQLSPDGAAARIRSPTSAQAQAAIAWTTVLSEAVSGSSEK